MRRRVIVFIITICVGIFVARVAANVPAHENHSIPEGLPFRPMSPEEIRYENLSRMPYRPSWAPLPLLKEHTELVGVLEKSLSSSDAGVRVRSSFLLGQIGSSSSKPLLVRLLKDNNQKVRLHSGIALACMSDARGLSACKTALAKEPRWVKYYAVLGLWSINNHDAKAVLEKYADNRDVLVGPAIRGALKHKFVKTPIMKPDSSVKPPESAEEAWETGANVLSSEADWWWHKGDYEQAIRCHEAAILLDPDYPEGYAIVAWLHWSKGRNGEAISALKRGIRAAPNNPEAYYNIGTHYYNIGRYKEAELYLGKAVALGGDHLARRMYAYTLEKHGKYEEALAQWKEIVKIRPDDDAAQRHLQKVQARLNAINSGK